MTSRQIHVIPREYEPGRWTHDVYVNGELRAPAVGLSMLAAVVESAAQAEHQGAPEGWQVSWSVDVDLAHAGTPREAAQYVAERYFAPRIASGAPESACVFHVHGTGRAPSRHPVTVDLSE